MLNFAGNRLLFFTFTMVNLPEMVIFWWGICVLVLCPFLPQIQQVGFRKTTNLEQLGAKDLGSTTGWDCFLTQKSAHQIWRELTFEHPGISFFCCVDPNVCLDLLPDGGIDGIIGDALAASPS